ALVAAHGVKQGDRLRHREGEIVTNRPFRPRPDRERLARAWVEVIAQPLEGVFVYRTGQPKPRCALAAPGADQFLSFTVIVRCSVITLGTCGKILLQNSDHA